MMKSRRAILTLSWQSVVYGAGVLGSQLIVYVLLPFLTRYMPREDYGVVSVMMALYGFLNMLTNAGLPSATFRFFNATEDESDKRLTLGGSQMLFFLFAALPAVFIVFFPKLASMLILGSEQYALALQLLAGYLIVDSLNTYGNIVLRIETRALASSLHNIFLIACKTGLALLFVIRYDLGVAGYWLGYLLGEFLGLILMMWLVRRNISFRVSRARLAGLLRLGLPMIPASVSMTVLRLADRYIISALAGLEQVAVYDVGYKIGSIILLLIVPFRTAWNPFAFSIANKPEAPKIFRDVLTYLTAGCIFLILGVLAFRSELIQLLAPASYSNAGVVVGWIAAAQLFYAVYFIFQIGPLIGNKPSQLAWSGVASGVLYVILNFILIPVIGILGAAVATLIGYVMLAGMSYYYCRQSFEMHIDWPRLGKLALASGLVALLMVVIESSPVGHWVEITLKAASLFCWPFLLLWFGFIKPAQRKELLELGKRLLDKRLGSKDKQVDTV